MAGLVLAVAAAVAPIPANAHAILVESTPAAKATLPPGETRFTLRYNSRIDRDRSRLTLTRPDRSQEVLPLAATATEDVLSTTATLAAGAYVLRWQVLAVDGHVTRGDLPFTVKAP